MSTDDKKIAFTVIIGIVAAFILARLLTGQNPLPFTGLTPQRGVQGVPNTPVDDPSTQASAAAAFSAS